MIGIDVEELELNDEGEPCALERVRLTPANGFELEMTVGCAYAIARALDVSVLICAPNEPERVMFVVSIPHRRLLEP